METRQEGILKAILQEQRGITEEVGALKGDLKRLRVWMNALLTLCAGLCCAVGYLLWRREAESSKSKRQAGVDPRRWAEPLEVVGVADESDSTSSREEDAFLSMFDWLASRDITVKNHKQQKDTDEIFDRLAIFLGERFDSLVNLHDQIRRNLSNGSSFTLNLASSSQEEIANSTQLCTWLHQYAFLSSYRYNKYSKTIHAAPQRVGRVINFFTGGWFERFIFLKVSSFLSQKGLDYVWLINPQITLPNGDDFELDLLFLVENQPLWLECKTGDYSSYIAKYASMRPILAVPEERSILVILGISDDLTSQLTDLYDLTVANESNFLAQVGAAFDMIEIPCDTPSITPSLTTPMEPEKLSTLLNKAGLRPLPTIRPEVISRLIEVVESMDEPSTLFDVKSILAERIETSNSKLQDILNAIARSGCFLNEQGETVQYFGFPFSDTASLNPEEIERKCVESYVRAVLVVDLTYFENEKNVVTFEEVVGGKAPDAEAIEKLKREAETSAVSES